MTTITTLLLASVGGMQSCRKKKCHDPQNPDCENYDPCWGKKATSAEFEIGSYVGQSSIIINGNTDTTIVDTIFSYNFSVRFTAKEEKALKYTWLLGSEIINSRSFYRSFYTFPEGKFNVTLIVDKEPHKACFPNDDGKDTIKKTFYIKPVFKFPIMGDYKVLFKGEKDSCIVKIKPWESTLNKNSPIIDFNSTKNMMLFNFANTQDTVKSQWVSDIAVFTGNQLIFMDVYPRFNSFDTPTRGSVRVYNNSIEANYDYYNKERSFKGRKIK